MKPFAHLLPARLINRVPVVGTINLPVPNSEKVLILSSRGADPIASGLYWGGIESFEAETFKVYFDLLKTAEVVFDIGANTGIFALLAAIDCKDRQVHAFEPAPKIFDYLQRNATINKLNNLKPVCSALTDYDGEIDLYIPYSVLLPTSSSTLKGFRQAQETVTVPAVKLDTYAAVHHISKVDLLKIDTEGTEPKVLEGAKSILDRDKPVIICEVLKNRTENALNAIFARSNYKFFLITNDGLVHQDKIVGDASYRARNYLFITPDKLAQKLPKIPIV
ncbi:MAG TPA: FkbM family methyltransferase [Anaerolineae bacterium]|nr:FkbM family methyltransferase [Anaerolineae bacterium]